MKIAVVGIVLVFLSVVALPMVAAEGLPDYTPTKIYRAYGNYPPLAGFVVEVNNTGNATSNGTLHYHITATKLFLDIIPLRSITLEGNVSAHYLTPGKTFDCSVYLNFVDLWLITNGFYKLTSTVNPHYSIGESNFDNNFIQAKYFRDNQKSSI